MLLYPTLPWILPFQHMMVLHILVMMISTLNGSNIKTGTCLGLAGASTLAEVPLIVPEMVKWWGWTHELNTE